ncbi:MAG: hypothetical protein HQL57_02590 [Magnetococcales bacterium]|nr:hypothetical protein [Magnetococcales bacterium]
MRNSPPFRLLRLVGTLLPIAAAGYALVRLIQFPDWVVDDAFIAFRYTENLLLHGELNWNPGEDPVEGYTGIMLPVLLALLSLLGLTPQTGSHLLGATSYIATATLFWLFARQLGIRSWLTHLIWAVWLTYPALFTHATSGMETLAFTALLTGTLMLLHKALGQAPEHNPAITAALLISLATGLTRPEGALMMALGFLVLLDHGRRHKAFRSTVVRILALAFLPGLVYFLWRFHYYGQLLPNTFYVKSASIEALINADSISALRWFLQDTLFFPILASGTIWLPFLASPRNTRSSEVADGRAPGSILLTPTARIATITALFVTVVIALYLHSYLAMNYSHRFFVPLLPPLLLGCGLALEQGVRRLDRRTISLSTMTVLGVATAALVFQIGLNIRNLQKELNYVGFYRQLMNDEHIAIGRLLGSVFRPDETLSVMSDAGAMPYFSRMRTIDYGSLNSKILARGNLNEKTSIDYFFDTNSVVLVFTSHDPDPDKAYGARYRRDPRFGQYRLYRIFGNSAGRDYYQVMYVRRDAFSRLPPPPEETSGKDHSFQ